MSVQWDQFFCFGEFQVRIRAPVPHLGNVHNFYRLLNLEAFLRLMAGIECWNIDQTLKPLFETTKQQARIAFLSLIGIDIGRDLTGGEIQKIFLKVNHQKIVQIIPEEKQENFSHFLKETTFQFGVMCHGDPASVLSLDEAELRLRYFQLFIIDTYPNYDQTPYVHMGLMHVVQLLSRGKRSISSYGTQNKEAKNKMQRDFFQSFSRKDDNWHALEDTYLRDALVTSYTLRSRGSCEPTQKCSRCKLVGHRVNKCPEGGLSDSTSGKFLDLQDFSDPLQQIRDGDDDPPLSPSSEDDSSSKSSDNGENPMENLEMTQKNKQRKR